MFPMPKRRPKIGSGAYSAGVEPRQEERASNTVRKLSLLIISIRIECHNPCIIEISMISAYITVL